MLFDDLFPPKLNLEIKYENEQVGSLIGIKGRDDIEDKHEIAIIGIVDQNTTMPDDIRIELYQLYDFGAANKIYDAGNYWLNDNEEGIDAASGIIEQLKQHFKFVLVLSAKYYIDLLHKVIDKSMPITWVHTECNAKLDAELLKGIKATLFAKTNLLAYQSYLVSTSQINKFEDLGNESFRLGDIINDKKGIEPFMRESDSVAFNFDAVQNSYFLSQNNASPNGLNGETLCLLARYAGASPRVGFAFMGNSKPSLCTLSAKSASQAIWYLFEGYSVRLDEDPLIENSACIKYITELKVGHFKLIFFESKRTGRWWMYLPLDDEEMRSRAEFLVPCTENDYKVAMLGEIPDRWLKAIERIKY